MLWILFSSLLAVFDFSNVSVYSGWRNEGITTVPPTDLREGFLQFARAEGIACSGLEEAVDDLNNQSVGDRPCLRIWNYVAELQDTRTRTDSMLFLTIIAMIALAFPLGSFTYRVSRNLLTLRSAGQRFRPEMAVLWLFLPFGLLALILLPLRLFPDWIAPVFLVIPALPVFRSFRAFSEMFKASDPTVPLGEDTAWQNKGKVAFIVYIWGALFVAMVVFNPLTIGRVWLSVDGSLSSLISATWGFFVGDIIMILFALLTLIVALSLHRLQEQKFAHVGRIVVRPPLPRDPLEDLIEKDTAQRANQR